MADPASKRGVLIMQNCCFTRNCAWLRAFFFLSCVCLCLLPAESRAGHDLIVVTGHPGEAGFGAEMEATAALWEETAKRAGHSLQRIATGEGGQLQRLLAALSAAPAEAPEPLWVVLLGHGNAQGKAPRFNLAGADLTAEDLARGLNRFRRPVIVVAGFACSGAFLKPLAAPGRIVLAATRTGAEENWTRFPKYFATALAGLDADANGDLQVSVLEAWQHAVRTTEGSYKDQGRLATEHSALDDLGDGKASGTGLGMRASQWHLVESAAETALTPRQRSQRESVELEITELRQKKASLPPDEYADALEKLLLRLADVYAGKPEGSAEETGRRR
jgi:hypothetical protein